MHQENVLRDFVYVQLAIPDWGILLRMDVTQVTLRGDGTSPHFSSNTLSDDASPHLEMRVRN